MFLEDTRLARLCAAMLMPVASVVLCLLAGCDNSEKRAAAFMPKCEAAKFSREQCAFLFALSEKAGADSADATALSAVALGTAVGAATGRR